MNHRRIDLGRCGSATPSEFLFLQTSSQGECYSSFVVTHFKYNKNDYATELEKKCQVSFGTLALVICVGLQVLFIVEFGDHKAEIYSAYLQNIAMSIAYLYLLNRRRSSKGQTRLIAICKWIGTLTPTLIGVIERNHLLCAGRTVFLLPVLCAKERAEIIVDPVRKGLNILEKAGCSHGSILPFLCL
ncbi:MAG: hypothetical protein ACLTYL_09090 [Faecalibacterium sp.]